MNSKFGTCLKTNMAAHNKACKKKVLHSRQSVYPSRLSKLPVTPKSVKCVNTGEGPCSLCQIADVKNMVQCNWCSKWTHGSCLGIKPDQLITLLEVKTEYPFQCKGCRTLLQSQWGKILKDLNSSVEEVVDAVSQTK